VHEEFTDGILAAVKRLRELSVARPYVGKAAFHAARHGCKNASKNPAVA
jgi:hypothetical protein